MSTFPCPICNKIFFRYFHWENHLNRKTSCLKPFLDQHDNNSEDESEIKTEVNNKSELVENINKNVSKCKYCSKVYSRDDSLLRHINNSSCKYKKEFDDLNPLNKNANNYEKYPISIQLIDMIIDKSKKIEELNNKIDDNKKINEIVSSDVNINKMKESSQLVLNDIVIIARKEDNFVNATQLCLAGNKLFADWYRLNSTKELIKELENCEIKKADMGNPDMGIPISANLQVSDVNNQIYNNLDIEYNDNIINYNNISSQKAETRICVSANSSFSEEKFISSPLIKITKGGNNKHNQGTWIHPDLAIQLAQWISPKFALQVSKWIRTLFTTGTVSLNKLLEEKDHELKLKDEKIQLLQNSFLKKQHRMDYPEKYVIYMLTNEDNKNKRIYIIGKATNLKERLSSYNKTSEHEVVYYKSCIKKEYMKTIEEMILLKLELYREQANRDRFILPNNANIKLFTDIIDDSIKFIIPSQV